MVLGFDCLFEGLCFRAFRCISTYCTVLFLGVVTGTGIPGVRTMDYSLVIVAVPYRCVAVYPSGSGDTTCRDQTTPDLCDDI